MNRPIRIDGDVAYVPLTRGYEAIIDASDVDRVGGWDWFAKPEYKRDGSIRAVYAARKETVGNGKQRDVLMHRVIAGTATGLETDHRDGDGLNNRRCNLRDATKDQNRRNRAARIDSQTGAKGVYLHTDKKKWRAQIFADGKRRHLGLFSTIEEASAAYAKASAIWHGEFGRAA